MVTYSVLPYYGENNEGKRCLKLRFELLECDDKDINLSKNHLLAKDFRIQMIHDPQLPSRINNMALNEVTTPLIFTYLYQYYDEREIVRAGETIGELKVCIPVKNVGEMEMWRKRINRFVNKFTTKEDNDGEKVVNARDNKSSSTT